MTREEAIEVYNGLINTKIKEAFEFFAPELRESEDERIKRELTGFIGQALHSGGGVVVSPEKERTWIEWIMGRQEEHWKPNQEQMYILNWVANVLLDENGVVERAAAEKLRVLYNDLKKLK